MDIPNGTEFTVLVAGPKGTQETRKNHRAIPQGLYLRHIRITQKTKGGKMLLGEDGDGAKYRLRKPWDKPLYVTTCSQWVYCHLVDAENLEAAERFIDEIGQLYALWHKLQEHSMKLKSYAGHYAALADRLEGALDQDILNLLQTGQFQAIETLDMVQEKEVCEAEFEAHPQFEMENSDVVRAYLRSRTKVVKPEPTDIDPWEQIRLLEESMPHDAHAEVRRKLAILRTQTLMASNGIFTYEK